MATRKYATIGDFARYTGQPAPDDFDQSLLVRASRRIDRVLIGAIYPVDDAGMPTDPPVIEALRDATCALAAWWDEQGETGSGATAELSEVAIGNVRLKRAIASAAGRSPTARREVPASVLDVLQVCLTSEGRPLLPHTVIGFG